MKIIETKKVANVNEAVNIINRLNYRNDTFEYAGTTREDNADIQYRHFHAYKADGEQDGFAMIEIVVNGKLEIVRFFNLFRDITVDLKLGDFNPEYDRYDAVINADHNSEEKTQSHKEEPKMTIETKITKNGALTLKMNGKRSNRHDVIYSLFRYTAVGTEIKTSEGKIFTCTGTKVPAPSPKCPFMRGYSFTDENGKIYFFNTGEEALNRIAHNNFSELNFFPSSNETPLVTADVAQVGNANSAFSTDDKNFAQVSALQKQFAVNALLKHGFTFSPEQYSEIIKIAADADKALSQIFDEVIISPDALQVAVDAEIALANNNHNNKIITVEDQIVLLYDNIVDAQTALSKTTNPDVKAELETNIDDWLHEIATLLLPKLNENFIDSSLDFDTKDAILKAKVLVADKESQIALDSLNAAEKAYQDALRVHCDSGDKLFFAKRAHEKFCRAKARQLEKELLPEPLSTEIILRPQNGEKVVIDTYIFPEFYGDKFRILTPNKDLAAYDTVAQLETVINNLKAAVARGDKEFVFPTIEELTKPPAAEKQIIPVKDKKVEFCWPDEYDADATLERLCSLPVIGEDGLTDEDRAFRDDLIKTYDEYQAKKKTPSDISDSLARAMKLSLENVQSFCRDKNLAAAQYELNLYNICSNALIELRNEKAARLKSD